MSGRPCTASPAGQPVICKGSLVLHCRALNPPIVACQIWLQKILSLGPSLDLGRENYGHFELTQRMSRRSEDRTQPPMAGNQKCGEGTAMSGAGPNCTAQGNPRQRASDREPLPHSADAPRGSDLGCRGFAEPGSVRCAGACLQRRVGFQRPAEHLDSETHGALFVRHTDHAIQHDAVR